MTWQKWGSKQALEKRKTKNVDLKTGFLRKNFWTFIEVKRTFV
jgi:hypothetical protein